MDDYTKFRWQQLVDQFGVSKAGMKPWDAKRLESAFEGSSHGERCVIQFLLNVWDPGNAWACGKFDAIDAVSVWDDRQREAFLFWVNDPWWP